MSAWLNRYAKIVAGCTVLLIAAGGMVTSTDSGLAVPDWPNTYGQFMFTFPFEKMVGGILYEHGHRLIASTVGFLTIILAFWTWRAESRRRVRMLALLALGAVILQGLLGGLTVLLRLPPAVSIGHASLAQLFFCLTIALAQLTSPAWRSRNRASASSDDPGLERLAVTTTALIYGQIVAGATMRHLNAGLAIPDFPLVFGGLVPPFWSAGIAVHYLHRLGAIAVTLCILATARRVWNTHGDSWLRRPAMLLVFLVGVQLTLGAFVILSGLQPVVNTAHVVNGALVLATSLVLTLRSAQGSIDRFLARDGDRTAPAGAAPIQARP